MKKRFFASIVILLVILIPFTQSKLLEKQTTELIDIQLININLIDNKLKFTVLNNNNQELKLRFKLDSNLIYNDIILKSYTSQLYNLDYNKQSNLEITPYTIKDNNIVLYSLSTITYNLNNLESTASTSASTSITEVTTSDIITSNTRASYIYSNRHRTASISNKGINYYHDDILSSTRLISSNDNLVIASYDYYPFGSDLKSSSSNNKKYTGKELDSSSNLYYYNARYYNSNNGRFISVDPIFDTTESSYSYVNNNPIIKTDPTGRNEFDLKNKDSFDSEIKPKYLKGIVKVFEPLEVVSDKPREYEMKHVVPVEGALVLISPSDQSKMAMEVAGIRYEELQKSGTQLAFMIANELLKPEEARAGSPVDDLIERSKEFVDIASNPFGYLWENNRDLVVTFGIVATVVFGAKMFMRVNYELMRGKTGKPPSGKNRLVLPTQDTSLKGSLVRQSSPISIYSHEKLSPGGVYIFDSKNEVLIPLQEKDINALPFVLRQAIKLNQGT